ncbi:hypothetical protein T492DRAFT_1009094 [Pavlovales sp. CCMP2436]|nr:hypothetical protein T492DRAFT_1009094 [Pavlovales sp. CCMP2436]
MHGSLIARRSLTRIARTGLAPLLFGLAYPPRLAMSSSVAPEVDPVYPGTALARMRSSRERVRELAAKGDFAGRDWEDVRRSLLFAAGLRDLPNAAPGAGYTGHAFNDWNHCDATTMRTDVADSENQGRVPGIAFNNPLGRGIRIASLPELGPGGTWSTCLLGCNELPPQDVAHVQFQSRIAFKLVWLPPAFETFALVDDDGAVLARGAPTGRVPPMRERQRNYNAVQGGKYDCAASCAAA